MATVIATAASAAVAAVPPPGGGARGGGREEEPQPASLPLGLRRRKQLAENPRLEANRGLSVRGKEQKLVGEVGEPLHLGAAVRAVRKVLKSLAALLALDGAERQLSRHLACLVAAGVHY